MMYIYVCNECFRIYDYKFKDNERYDMKCILCELYFRDWINRITPKLMFDYVFILIQLLWTEMSNYITTCLIIITPSPPQLKNFFRDRLSEASKNVSGSSAKITGIFF